MELQDPEATTHSDTDDQRIQFRGRRRGRGKNKKRGRGRKECQKLLRRTSSVMLQPGGGARMDSSPSSAETSPPGLATNSIFSVSFCIIDLHGGQINEPSWGKHYSLPFLPATPSSPSRALLLELHRYKDTVRCAALGAEVPGHRQQQLTQTWIVRLLKTHLFTPIPDSEKSTE